MTKDNETESTSKLNKSEQKPSAISQLGEHVWLVKDSAIKAEIIATLQFAAQNVPFSYVLVVPVAATKTALLGMKTFNRTVIKDFQKMMPIEDTLLKAIKCLSLKEHDIFNSFQHCRVIASDMLNVQLEEEVTAGDERIAII